jgi:hypothetical protein
MADNLIYIGKDNFNSGDSTAYVFHITLYSITDDIKLKVPLPVDRINFFTYENSFNTLCLTGSFQFEDVDGLIDKFLHK